MSVSIDADDDLGVVDCNQIKVTFDDEPAVRAEENIPASSLSRLRVNAERHGGVRVTGWDQSGWSIKACKMAASAGALSDIHVNLRGDELSSESLGQDAFVYFIIRSPRNATLDVDSSNGPIGLYDVNGTVRLNAENGPISLKKSSGTIDATTVNGPISFGDGGSGTVKLTAQNGPISVKLDGDSWNGSLDASTQNGPLSIKLPRNYRSGVLAEARGHGPVSCRADFCSGAKRTWDDDENRRIELGSGPTVIHVSTNNGPLSIKER
ncbi:MAG TPA: hypothetical protein VJ901_16090 [Thermoanaerobaculia bacterium]|nr:hypothetical protein [Thermoanaerobaculia bacterium]